MMRLGAVISASLASIAARWAMIRSSMLAEIVREGVPLTRTIVGEDFVDSHNSDRLRWFSVGLVTLSCCKGDTAEAGRVSWS